MRASLVVIDTFFTKSFVRGSRVVRTAMMMFSPRAGVLPGVCSPRAIVLPGVCDDTAVRCKISIDNSFVITFSLSDLTTWLQIQTQNRLKMCTFEKFKEVVDSFVCIDKIKPDVAELAVKILDQKQKDLQEKKQQRDHNELEKIISEQKHEILVLTAKLHRAKISENRALECVIAAEEKAKQACEEETESRRSLIIADRHAPADQERCSICTFAVYQCDSWKPRCGHSLHPKCMEQMISSRITHCPQCRQQMSFAVSAAQQQTQQPRQTQQPHQPRQRVSGGGSRLTILRSLAFRI